MTKFFRKTSAVGIVCVMMLLSGCSGFQPANQSPSTTTPGTSIADTPSTPTGTSENSTKTSTAETVAPEGLLIVEIVENGTKWNDSETVQYNQTIFNQAPTLDEAVSEAVSTNSTQTRDLSSQEVKQVELVAEEYNKPTGRFIILKNGTAVRISLTYEA